MPSRSVYPLKAATTADSAVRSVTSRRSEEHEFNQQTGPDGPSVGASSSLNVFVLQRRVGTGRLRIGPRHSRRGNSRVTLYAAAARRSTAGQPHQAPCPPKLTFGGRALGSPTAGSGRLFRITQFACQARRSLLPAKEDLVRALLAEAQNHVLRASRRITSARCRFQTLDVCNRTGENNNMQRATSIIVGQGDIACPVLQAHFCCLQAAHKGRFTISSSTWCRSLKPVDRGRSALPRL